MLKVGGRLCPHWQKLLGKCLSSTLRFGEGWDDVFPYFFGGEELGIMCFPFVFHTFLGGG